SNRQRTTIASKEFTWRVECQVQAMPQSKRSEMPFWIFAPQASLFIASIQHILKKDTIWLQQVIRYILILKECLIFKALQALTLSTKDYLKNLVLKCKYSSMVSSSLLLSRTFLTR